MIYSEVNIVLYFILNYNSFVLFLKFVFLQNAVDKYGQLLNASDILVYNFNSYLLSYVHSTAESFAVWWTLSQ